jgi:hypothetical protein
MRGGLTRQGKGRAAAVDGTALADGSYRVLRVK